MGDDKRPQPPAINAMDVAANTGSLYPEHLGSRSETRIKRAVGDALGLTKFGVNITVLPPDSWSAFRHWHETEDEFVYILEGEAILVTDAGEQKLGPGMAAGFPAGKADGHHLVNRSGKDVIFLEVGNRFETDDVHYPDTDLHLSKRPDAREYKDKQGNPLAARDAGTLDGDKS